MKKEITQKKQKGQAMVETALVLPLLIILLLGVGYFGSVITMQHNLTVAARYAARAVAVESTKDPKDRVWGTFFVRVTPKMFKDYAMRALPGFKENRISVQPIPVEVVLPFKDFGNTSSFTAINDYTYLYLISGEAHASSNNINKTGSNSVPELKSMKVGLGAVFYGIRLTYRLAELDWIARFLFRKKEGVTIDAISMMPAELPLRSGSLFGLHKVNSGLMDQNEGLFNIIRTDPNDPNAKSYVDLIPKNQ